MWMHRAQWAFSGNFEHGLDHFSVDYCRFFSAGVNQAESTGLFTAPAYIQLLLSIGGGTYEFIQTICQCNV